MVSLDSTFSLKDAKSNTQFLSVENSRDWAPTEIASRSQVYAAAASQNQIA